MTKTIASDVIWEPTNDYLNCRVSDFMRANGISDYKELIKRSQEDT